MLTFIVIGIEPAAEGGNLDQGAPLAHVGKPEAAADQAAAWKNVLDFLGRRTGGDIKVLGRLAQQQVAHTAADDERFETRLLQAANDIRRVRAKLLEPYPVLGLGYGNEVVNDDLRFVTG